MNEGHRQVGNEDGWNQANCSGHGHNWRADTLSDILYYSSKNTVYDLIDAFLPHEKSDGFPLKSPQ